MKKNVVKVINRYLLFHALKTKGIKFVAYCYVANLIMSLCIITGALCEAFKQVQK